MKYIICQDWSNTSNNHAGMKYLAKRMEALRPTEFKAITVPDFFEKVFKCKSKILRRFLVIYARFEHYRFIRKLTKRLLSELTLADSVYLFEYLERMTPQLYIAKHIRKKYKEMPINAMVHLVPQKLDKGFGDSEFIEWMQPISKVITLGASLSSYLEARGISPSRIGTTFHYVDMDYYHNEPKMNKKVSVIAMGNQMRNISLLKDIVNHNPAVDFTICQGVLDFSDVFSSNQNVKLIPFVSEDELRGYMSEADISLNVMDDTIGSNVIVTSMAMGLAMVCSDVGSIRDYCDESNTIFCNNSNREDFSFAISKLSNDSLLLQQMKQSSVKKAEQFNIISFIESLKHC